MKKQAEPDILAKWANVPKFAGKWKCSKPIASPQKPAQAQELTLGEGRAPTRFVPGVGARVEPKVYTGSAMIGIGQMHKSNAVPVFAQEEAIELARMRRG